MSGQKSAGKAAALPVLSDTEQLLAFLQSTLVEIEAEAGEEAPECRAKLQQLTAVLGKAPPRQALPPQADELAIASHIDRCARFRASNRHRCSANSQSVHLSGPLAHAAVQPSMRTEDVS